MNQMLVDNEARVSPRSCRIGCALFPGRRSYEVNKPGFSFFVFILCCSILVLCCVKKIGGWWRWALLSPDGVAPSRMVGVSASVNLPLHHKVQRFSYGTGSPG